MDRKALRIVALALLVLVVISVAAATLDSSRQTESGGFGIGPGAGSIESDDAEDPGSVGDGEGGGGVPLNESLSEGTNSGFGICIPFFLRLEGQLALVLALVGIWVLMAKLRDRMLAFAGTYVIAIVGFFVLLFLTNCGGRQRFDISIATSAAGEAGGRLGEGLSGAASAVNETQISPILLVFAGVFLAVLAAAMVMNSGGSDEDLVDEQVAEDGDAGTERTLEAIGRMAGRAADRIDEVGAFENEVYRAWTEMTTELDVDHPQSSTPGEFATEAIDAGMAPEDVNRLTELFEAVRYGGREPTEKRERTAIETLRRIEDQYADD
ncbi:MAG: hypothetical protein ACI91T_001455 [Natronomonas sp.]|jgi:hypothetical protein